MLRRFALSVAVLLSLAVTAQAASVITVGDGSGTVTLLPNLAGQEVQVFVSSPDNDPYQVVNLKAWFAEGFFGAASSAPNITNIDMLTGTIFENSNNGQQSALAMPLVWETTVTTNPNVGDGTVEANGLLATFTFDTTLHSSGSWFLDLDGVPSLGFTSTNITPSAFPGGGLVPEPTFINADIVIEGGTVDPFPGDSPDNPILPDNFEGEPPWIFTNVNGGENPDGTTGLWFDPIITDAYIFETDGTSNFTQVGLPPLAIVPDADGNYVITRGSDGAKFDVAPGAFFDFDGVPQELFIISGIFPHVDGEDPLAFPTFLAFDELVNSFTMTPVPEPSSLVLAGLGVLGLVGYGLRRRSA